MKNCFDFRNGRGTRETTKCECGLRARTEKDGKRQGQRERGGRGGGRGRQSLRTLSSRMPPGKLLTVRTFRETPVPPNPFWPLSLAICPPQEGTVLAGTARNSHSSLQLFSFVSHSRTVFFRSSRALGRLFLRDSGRKKRRRPE